MQIIDGGIGKPYATIAVTLPEKSEIDTEFYFYGDAVSPRLIFFQVLFCFHFIEFCFTKIFKFMYRSNQKPKKDHY